MPWMHLYIHVAAGGTYLIQAQENYWSIAWKGKLQTMLITVIDNLEEYIIAIISTRRQTDFGKSGKSSLKMRDDGRVI